jgi:hypothetical protein
MAAGRVSRNVIIGHDGEPSCPLVAPVWVVLALTADGFLVALALKEPITPSPVRSPRKW